MLASHFQKSKEKRKIKKQLQHESAKNDELRTKKDVAEKTTKKNGVDTILVVPPKNNRNSDEHDQISFLFNFEGLAENTVPCTTPCEKNNDLYEIDEKKPTTKSSKKKTKQKKRLAQEKKQLNTTQQLSSTNENSIGELVNDDKSGYNDNGEEKPAKHVDVADKICIVEKEQESNVMQDLNEIDDSKPLPVNSKTKEIIPQLQISSVTSQTIVKSDTIIEVEFVQNIDTTTNFDATSNLNLIIENKNNRIEELEYSLNIANQKVTSLLQSKAVSDQLIAKLRRENQDLTQKLNEINLVSSNTTHHPSSLLLDDDKIHQRRIEFNSADRGKGMVNRNSMILYQNRKKAMMSSSLVTPPPPGFLHLPSGWTNSTNNENNTSINHDDVILNNNNRQTTHHAPIHNCSSDNDTVISPNNNAFSFGFNLNF